MTRAFEPAPTTLLARALRRPRRALVFAITACLLMRALGCPVADTGSVAQTAVDDPSTRVARPVLQPRPS